MLIPAKLMGLLVGSRIRAIRPMTQAEIQHESWDQGGSVIVLDNDVKIYAMADPEGNGVGALNITTKNGKSYAL